MSDAKPIDPKLFKVYGVSKKKAQEGVWVVPDCMVGVENPQMFKLARMNKVNSKYQAQVTKYAVDNRRKFQVGSLSVEEQMEKALRIFCETVLLDWKNLFDEGGNQIPYTPELGYYFMTEMDDLYQELSAKATERDLFQPEEVNDDLGKSENS